MMMDLMVLAFWSDSTRVSSFMFGNDVTGRNFSFLEGGILKVELTAPEIIATFPSMLTVPDVPKHEWYKSDNAARTLEAAGISVSYSADGAGITVRDSDGKTFFEIPSNGVNWKEDGSYSVSFKKEAGDRYFGLGEPMPDPLGLPVSYENKGNVRPIWNRHVPPADMGIPFFFNPRGYALFVDNPWKADFDFTKGGAFTYRATGGPLRFYVIAAPDAFRALERYTALTGRPPIPPRWSTGYMQSRFGYRNEKDYRWLMENFRNRKLPCDTLIFDLDWFGDGMMGNLWWNPVNFPKAVKFQKELARQGFKTITIVEPYIFKRSYNFKQAFGGRLLTMNSNGEPYVFPFWGGAPAGLMDFSNPDTQKWFAEKISRIHRSGVDAWWTDLDEPENDWDDTFYLLGRREAAHNLQAFLMNKTIHDLYDEKFPNERPFIMSRSGFAGIQRFGTSVWSGDVQASFQHLTAQVPVALSTSLSGIPFWNSDTGGFHNKPSTELYVRWFQFSAFNPIFRSHGNHSEREPWSFGDEAEKICRRYLDLRYSLSPYLYSLMRRSSVSGAPIMTPMFMEFPDDPKLLV
ncbi:MAG TPA: glycoside hydrolase family 31 protein, partial [bacterium]|nr:glycoside hydrolase family 31 protein [bacterium]